MSNKDFDVLINNIKNCHKCSLSENRSNVVISAPNNVLNNHNKVMFIGEAPGADEDLAGVPFIGRSGKLLRSIAEKANINIEENVYITNICKCRPPKNRKPTMEEINTCTPFLLNEINIIKPGVIVCFGSTAAQSLLFPNNKKAPTITNLKGQVFDFIANNNFLIKVIPTFHPSYLLRNRSLIDSCIEDLEKIHSFINI